MPPFTESSTLKATIIKIMHFQIKLQFEIVSESLKKIIQQLKGRFAHTIFFTVFSCDVKCVFNTRPFWGVYISFFLWCSLCKLVHWQMLCFLGPLTWTVCCVRRGEVRGRWRITPAAERGNRLLSSVHILILWLHCTYWAPYSANLHGGGNSSILNSQHLLGKYINASFLCYFAIN